MNEDERKSNKYNKPKVVKVMDTYYLGHFTVKIKSVDYTKYNLNTKLDKYIDKDGTVNGGM